MAWKYYSIVLCTLALLFAGCSSHPPSAAQFMNVKKNDGKFSVGGVFLTGDLYDKEGTYISDESKGVFYVLSGYGRVDYFEIGVSLEIVTLVPIIGVRGEYFGMQGWGFFRETEHCDGKSHTIWIGGGMLIQQYPISENIKVGLSEHISNNLRATSDPDDYGSFNFKNGYYPEFGVGTYLTYKGSSIEFRYGREIGKPHNRFYFMFNYGTF